jgi:hypothetical protein
LQAVVGVGTTTVVVVVLADTEPLSLVRLLVVAHPQNHHWHS